MVGNWKVSANADAACDWHRGSETRLVGGADLAVWWCRRGLVEQPLHPSADEMERDPGANSEADVGTVARPEFERPIHPHSVTADDVADWEGTVQLDVSCDGGEVDAEECTDLCEGVARIAECVLVTQLERPMGAEDGACTEGAEVGAYPADGGPSGREAAGGGVPFDGPVAPGAHHRVHGFQAVADEVHEVDVLTGQVPQRNGARS